ncbi:MAG: hypothetical protein WC753_01190 [Candidatus Gracilibacteria bacterium]
MNKYFTEKIEQTFRSIRKEAREKVKISFSRAYGLVIILLIMVGGLYVWILNANANSGYQMTSIESIRRERQQTKHTLRSKIAKQESPDELYRKDDRMRPVDLKEITYITLP